jgi:hypothetical protein
MWYWLQALIVGAVMFACFRYLDGRQYGHAPFVVGAGVAWLVTWASARIVDAVRYRRIRAAQAPTRSKPAGLIKPAVLTIAR